MQLWLIWRTQGWFVFDAAATEDFDKLGMNWWYVGPRNGHISMFSRDALIKAWRSHGCQTGSFNDKLHVAFRTMPDFAKHYWENRLVSCGEGINRRPCRHLRNEQNRP